MKKLFNKAKNDQWEESETCMAIIARFGTGGGNTPVVIQMISLYALQAFGLYKDTGAASALKMRDYKDATDLILTGGGQSEMAVVRRLTPLECERLQGFPDGWTDIGDWEDSKGKKHKAADSPRYKALGNSIALPYWKVLARRIAAQYDRDITIGSLFDGIGGFPLAFQHCGATPVWASEIEEFCMAVTKKHFGDDDDQE